MENGQTNGSRALQTKLNEPSTVAALTRLLDRIESLEQTVNTLADLTQQGPGMAAMMGDMVDETVRQASANGVDVEARLRTGLEIAEKLTAPGMSEKIDQLLILADEAPGMAAMVGDMVDETIRQASANGVDVEARLRTGLEIAEKLTAPGMSEKIDQLLILADEAPGMMAMVGDMVDETIRQASANGVDLETRLRAGLAIANRLTEPQMIANLEQLLDMADEAPGMVAMVGDMVDETVRHASANGVDLESRAMAGLAMAEKLTAPEMMRAMDTLLDPKVVELLKHAGSAIAQSSSEPPRKLSLFGMLGAMRDPEMQKAMGFLASIGKNLGAQL